MMKSIVFVTVAPNDTLGDVSATSKLIHELLSRDKTLQFHWYVKRINSPTLDMAKFTPKERCQVTVIDDWNEIIDSKHHQSVFQSSKQIVAFPTFHWLSDRIKNFIYSFKIPFFAITEYDYEFSEAEVADARNSQVSPMVLHSGLGDQRLGIFIDPPAPTPTLLKADKDDLPFVSLLLNGQDLQSYHQDRQLFFGYFNSEEKSVDRDCLVTPTEFIKCAIYKATEQAPNKQNIDIVVRIDNMNTNDIVEKLKREHLFKEDTTIEFWHKVNNQMVKICPDQEVAVGSNLKKDVSAKKPVIRIMNPFRLSNNTFSSLLQASDPFCSLTGDQSFSEGIYKFFFYQTMNWKKELYTSYLNIVEKVVGRDSLLFRFVSMQHDSSKKISLFAKFKELLGDNPCDSFSQLKAQAEAVAEYILKHKNLRSNLPAKLLQFLDDPLTAVIDTAINYKDIFNAITYFPENLEILQNKYQNKIINLIKKEPLLHKPDFFHYIIKSEAIINLYNFNEFPIYKNYSFSSEEIENLSECEESQSKKRIRLGL